MNLVLLRPLYTSDNEAQGDALIHILICRAQTMMCYMSTYFVYGIFPSYILKFDTLPSGGQNRSLF